MIPLDYATHAFTLSYRYLASSTTAPEDPASKPVGVASEQTEGSGQADEAGPSGKPFRRGVISICRYLLRMSFSSMDRFFFFFLAFKSPFFTFYFLFYVFCHCFSF